MEIWLFIYFDNELAKFRAHKHISTALGTFVLEKIWAVAVTRKVRRKKLVRLNSTWSTQFFCRNFEAVPNSWQNCVQFELPKI